jgi:hypothetical protein
VLSLDPTRKDAGLTVGTYRYIVSTLSVPLRLMAYVAGFGGGRSAASRCCRRPQRRAEESHGRHVRARLVLQPGKRYDEALSAAGTPAASP